MLTNEQGAALELGFFMGSKFVLIALPKPLRQKSFAGIEYGPNQLRQISERLRIETTLVSGLIKLMDNAFAEDNSIEGAKKLLEIMNALKASLIEAFPPGASQSQTWRVYRIGISMGYFLEQTTIISKNNPTIQHLALYTGLSQQWRTPIPEDLAKCGLPTEVQEMVMATNMEVNRVEDLRAIEKKSREILNLALSGKH
jgi:hypothetical protein